MCLRGGLAIECNMYSVRWQKSQFSYFSRRWRLNFRAREDLTIHFLSKRVRRVYFREDCTDVIIAETPSYGFLKGQIPGRGHRWQVSCDWMSVTESGSSRRGEDIVIVINESDTAKSVPKKKTGIAPSKESFRTQASPASERQSACLLVNDSKVTLRIHGYACNLAILGSFAMVFDVLGFCKLRKNGPGFLSTQQKRSLAPVNPEKSSMAPVSPE